MVNKDTIDKQIPVPPFSRYVLVIILILGSIIWGILAILIQQNEREHQLNRFSIMANERIHSIERELNLITIQVDSIRSYLRVTENIQYLEFKEFVSQSISQGASLRSIAWCPLVLGNQRKAFIEKMQKEGYQSYKITSLTSSEQAIEGIPGDAVSFPVTYIVPSEGNENVIGYDLYSSAPRRRVMIRAVESGKTIASEKLTLLNDPAKMISYLLLSPIFKNGVSSVQNIDEVRGFVVGSVQVDALMQNALSFHRKAPLDIYVFDLENPKNDNLIYPNPMSNVEVPFHTNSHFNLEDFDHSGELFAVKRLDFSNRAWVVVCRAQPSLTKSSIQVWSVWLAGLLIMVLLAIVTQFIVYRMLERKALIALEKLMHMQTKDLKAAKDYTEIAFEELKKKVVQERIVTQQKLISLAGLTSGIAHEIKNPLNFINNFSDLSQDLIKEIEQKLDEQKAYISSKSWSEIVELANTLSSNMQFISDNGKKAALVIEGMELHAKLKEESDKILTAIAPLLDEALQVAYNDFSLLYPAFNCKVHKNYDSTIQFINIIPQDVSRGIINILSNAFYSVMEKKINLGDSYMPEVNITLNQKNDDIHIIIRDNGVGISNQMKSNLFTPFFTTRAPGKGTGLGLSIAYTIFVQEHNGNIEVNSEEGEYAEIDITIPTGLGT